MWQAVGELDEREKSKSQQAASPTPPTQPTTVPPYAWTPPTASSSNTIEQLRTRALSLFEANAPSAPIDPKKVHVTTASGSGPESYWLFYASRKLPQTQELIGCWLTIKGSYPKFTTYVRDQPAKVAIKYIFISGLGTACTASDGTQVLKVSEEEEEYVLERLQERVDDSDADYRPK
eukprot:TRINITY_DN60936_c0_g1_i2.p1 TRINITY_DN60936_c0_g1~~TRINITY_DN60936_c0_g1_i2.p1  ORF type:complete len:200 (+),score=21.11 TRINITY_DN60936_c0_g1_i2:70-600(+)